MPGTMPGPGVLKVSRNQTSDFLHHPHHNNECSRELIKQLRKFLAHAGVSPSTYEAEKDRGQPAGFQAAR